jgi:RNA polymerase sigma factor for flagellar operon FliA
MNLASTTHTPRCSRSAQLLAHRALVSRIAHRVSARMPANVEIDDLMQVGMLGLAEAIQRFDAERGASFDTYAARRIEGAMLDSLRAGDDVSRGTRARLRRVRTTVQRLEHRLTRAPRAREVANELGWTLQAFHDCLVEGGAAGARVGDADLYNLDDESGDHDELLASIDEHADPLHSLQQRQRHAALNAAFDMLEERERWLMEMMYRHGFSQHEASTQLGVSASMVSRMHEAIVVKLKRRLRDW